MSFMKDIGEIYRCANMFRTSKYEGSQIGSYQDSYIIHICKNPGVAQDKLSRIIYVHKSNVARQLASLEEKGFVERKADSNDKRNLLVYPTQKAYEALVKIKAVNKEWKDKLLQNLSKEQQILVEQVTDMLAKEAKEIIESEVRESEK